jgi:hypothetical protein
MSSFSLFDHKKYHCGLNKLLPAERLYTFSVLHYFQQRHVSWTPVFFADENIRAGYNFQSNPRYPMNNIPQCWDKLIAISKEDQAPKMQNSTLNSTHRYYKR